MNDDQVANRTANLLSLVSKCLHDSTCRTERFLGDRKDYVRRTAGCAHTGRPGRCPVTPFSSCACGPSSCAIASVVCTPCSGAKTFSPRRTMCKRLLHYIISKIKQDPKILYFFHMVLPYMFSWCFSFICIYFQNKLLPVTICKLPIFRVIIDK